MESDHSLRSSLGHPESSLAGGSGSSESSKKPQALGKSLRRRPKNSKPDIPPEGVNTYQVTELGSVIRLLCDFRF